MSGYQKTKMQMNLTKCSKIYPAMRAARSEKLRTPSGEANYPITILSPMMTPETIKMRDSATNPTYPQT